LDPFEKNELLAVVVDLHALGECTTC
jgi:hypothetical protein